jgi:hypothetical protein
LGFELGLLTVKDAWTTVTIPIGNFLDGTLVTAVSTVGNYFAIRAAVFTAASSIDMSGTLPALDDRFLSQGVRDGASYKLLGQAIGSCPSIYVDGAPATISHKITTAPTIDVNFITVDFTDLRQATQIQTNPSSLRSFTVTSHGFVAGDFLAFFSGDALVARSKVAKVISVNEFSCDLRDVPGADFVATHVGTTKATYATNTRVVHTRLTHSFYIPGLTAGISIPADIPAEQGDDTAQAQLALIESAATWAKVTGSSITQLAPALYMRTIEEAKVADIFPTL